MKASEEFPPSMSLPPLLLCFDFDGTLVDPVDKRSFSGGLADRLRILQHEREAVFVINTGRTLFQTLSGLREYGIDPFPQYIIAQERHIYQPGPYNRWVDKGDWNRRIEKEHRKLLRSARRFFKKTRSFLEQETEAAVLDQENTLSGITAADESEMDRICDWLDAELPAVRNLGYHRNSIYLRFGHRHHNKGSAMDELANQLGIAPEFRLAVGDNHNDLSMLDRKYAHGVACPGNAIPKVKQAIESHGGHVATAPCSRGVIQTLDHFFFETPAASA
jgi:HAD superfamily hydrolase (TIGR01484 family)